MCFHQAVVVVEVIFNNVVEVTSEGEVVAGVKEVVVVVVVVAVEEEPVPVVGDRIKPFTPLPAPIQERSSLVARPTCRNSLAICSTEGNHSRADI